MASPVPRMCTGGRGRSRARSADVTTTAPPASVTTQHIGRVNGYATSGASSTSSTVMGSRRSARGFRAAHSRCATTTCASVVASRPRSRRKRSVPSVRRVIGPAVPNGSSNWPCHPSGAGRNIPPPIIDRPLSPWAMSTTSHWPFAMAATAWRRCTRFEHPPTIVASTQRASIPSEWATKVGRYGLESAHRDSVDVGRSQPAVVERAARRFGCQRERRRVDGSDLGGLRRADDRCARRVLTTFSGGTRAAPCRPTVSNTTSTGRSSGSTSGSGSTPTRFVSMRGPSSSSTTAMTYGAVKPGAARWLIT